jgi:hypothetical protein
MPATLAVQLPRGRITIAAAFLGKLGYPDGPTHVGQRCRLALPELAHSSRGDPTTEWATLGGGGRGCEFAAGVERADLAPPRNYGPIGTEALDPRRERRAPCGEELAGVVDTHGGGSARDVQCARGGPPSDGVLARIEHDWLQPELLQPPRAHDAAHAAADHCHHRCRRRHGRSTTQAAQSAQGWKPKAECSSVRRSGGRGCASAGSSRQPGAADFHESNECVVVSAPIDPTCTINSGG